MKQSRLCSEPLAQALDILSRLLLETIQDVHC